MAKELIFRQFGDGGGIVTKTHDINAARDTIVKAFIDELIYDEEEAREQVDIEFPADAAELEVGRFIVCNPDNHPEGWSWMWKIVPDDQLGRPGVTRAVAWRV